MYHAQSYQLHSGCRRSFFLALHVGPHVRKLGENRGEKERSFMPKENAQSKILLRAFFFSKERGKYIYIYGTLINIYGTLKNIKKNMKPYIVNMVNMVKQIHQNGHNHDKFQSRRFQGRSIQAVKAPQNATPSRPRNRTMGNGKDRMFSQHAVSMDGL